MYALYAALGKGGSGGGLVHFPSAMPLVQTVLRALRIAIARLASLASFLLSMLTRSPSEVPVSVNYHLTRQCNYKCGFCFHTAKSSYVEKPEEAKRGLRLLKKAGMRKINFAGGEPFLEPKFLGELCRFAKEELQLPTVSIVSNGSKITESWLREYGKFVDILAISCDSFVEDTNVKIGRGKGQHLECVRRVAKWCRDPEIDIKFKLNSVINIYNWQEDMRKHIADLAPVRWKVFQVLTIRGENDQSGTCGRDSSLFAISDEQFNEFVKRHSNCGLPIVPEDNSTMQHSYLILDEYMCFLRGDDKRQSKSILAVGVHQALKEAQFDVKKFAERDGMYFAKPGFEKRGRPVDIEDLGKGMNKDPR